jgi:hypothetical protein
MDKNTFGDIDSRNTILWQILMTSLLRAPATQKKPIAGIYVTTIKFQNSGQF